MMAAVTERTTSARDDVLERAARVLPGGVSAGGRPDYGNIVTRAHGAYLWDADDQRYINHLNSYGPIVIGHTDQRVNAAVFDVASTVDLNWVGPQAGEVELAERIVSAMPSADKSSS